MRTFHIGDILSITHDYLVSPEMIDGVYKILNYMTSDTLQTLALVRTAGECRPYLMEALPFLGEIAVDELKERIATARIAIPNDDDWEGRCKLILAKYVDLYGEYHEVRPIHGEDHERLSPEEDLRRMRPDLPFISISHDEEQEPSPCGDINWKVDDDESGAVS